MTIDRQDLAAVEAAWGIALPIRFPELYADTDWHSIALPTGQQFRCPSYPLRCSEIVTARQTAEDWEIPAGLVPFSGDFHVLLCLDYRTSADPHVVMLDDDRSERKLFDTLDEFLDAPKTRDAPVSEMPTLISEPISEFSDEFNAKVEEWVKKQNKPQ